MKFNLVNSLVVIILLSVVYSCGESDNEMDLTFEEALAQISVENAEFVEEEMPSPTTDEETLTLDKTYNNIQHNVRPGETLVVSTLLKTGTASGFLISIDGVFGHFVTSTSQASNGKTQENNYASLRLHIPAKMKSGSFKIQFSIYDSNGEISGRINQTVSVTQETNDLFGGIERWTATRYQEYSENAVLYDSSISDPVNWESYIQFYCVQQEEILFFPYIRYTRQTVNLNLMQDNNFIEEFTFAYRPVNEEASYSSCSLIMVQDTIIHASNRAGTWSYNQTTQELSITYTHDYGMEREPYTLTYGLSIENNTLALSRFRWKDEVHGDVFERTIYIPKN